MMSTTKTVAQTVGEAIDLLPRAGRRRDPLLDEAILDAALTMFAEGGYRGVSIEGVAARAGVGKATVYRRHPTRAALLVDAVRIRLCLIHDLPDTGDLRADLCSLMQPLIDRLRSPDGAVLTAFMAERFREPELTAEFERSVIGRKREHTRRLFRKAIARGELPLDTDVELLAEIPAAIIWHHALNNLPIDARLASRIVDHVIGRSAGC